MRLMFTRKYDVSLMVARGYSSITFLDAAEQINDYHTEHPVYIYYLCDFDPSGDNACEECEEFLQEYAPDADIHFKVGLPMTPADTAVDPDRARHQAE